MNTWKLPLLIISLVISTSVFSQNDSPDVVYVWDFSDRNGKEDDLTASLTEEFEEALIKSDCCKVLQRRVYARIFQQRENEKAILSLSNLAPSTVKDLEAVEAQTVVFGQVYDDTSSGQFKISVSFEKFSGLIDKTASVYMAKFDISNPKKREAAIKELIDELKLKPGKPPVITENVDEWAFSFTGCERIGKDVKCSYTITSNYRDRKLTILMNSRAFDEYGYEYSPLSQQLANKSGSHNLSSLMIDGIQVSGFMVFKNVSSRANSFPLFRLVMNGQDLSAREIQFRDVVFQ
jgi:hypothetical protein